MYVTFTRRVYRGTEKSNSKISTSREDRISFGWCVPEIRQNVSCFYVAGEKDRVRIIPREERGIYSRGVSQNIYLVVVLYKYNEKILL